jgi:alpha/beta hydrolase fold
MSTTGDPSSGASEAAGLLGSDVREGYADIGDMRLHYVEAGEGPLVVLLHGFPEFWYGWRRQIQPLAAAGFRVVAPDLRGYNLSSRPKGVKAYDAGPLTADIHGLVHERVATSALLFARPCQPATDQGFRRGAGRPAGARDGRCCWPWPASHSPSALGPGNRRPRRTWPPPPQVPTTACRRRNSWPDCLQR